MFRSIRWRLIITYIMLTLLAVSLVGVLTLTLFERSVRQQEQTFLRANAEAVARQAELLLLPVFQRAQVEQLARTSAFLGDVQVRIFDPRGRLLADSGDPLAMGELAWVVQDGVVQDERFPGVFFAVPIASIDAVEQNGNQSQVEYYVVRKTTPYGGTRLSFEARYADSGEELAESEPTVEIAEAVRSKERMTVPMEAGGQTLGYVELSNGRSFGADSLNSIRRAFLIAAAGVSLLAVVLGLGVGQSLSAPVRQLTEVAGIMSAGDLSVRAEETRKDEIGALSRQFNQMATQLEASFADLEAERDALRRFIADASHELRTPITALRNFNELLQGAAKDDPVAQEEFLQESQTQLERLTWITENLLDLSRFDAGLMVLEKENVNMATFVSAVSTPFQQIALDQGVGLVIQPIAPNLAVLADEARLNIALSNLIDNALKFTDMGGEVRVGADKTDDRVLLWVQDSGRGIGEDDLPHIFKRFYRAGDGEIAGTGLGLAITHSIIHAHGGRLRVQSRLGVGSRFEVEISAFSPSNLS
jgi:signal transduction histidine kinase